MTGSHCSSHAPAAPFVLFGLAFFGAVSVLAHAPWLLVLAALFIVLKTAGHRAERWHHRRETEPGWSDPETWTRHAGRSWHRGERAPRRARRAYQSARDAVSASDALDDEEKDTLLRSLDDGFEQLGHLDDGREQAKSARERFRSMAHAAEERVDRFERDCRRVLEALSALAVQASSESLDGLSKAARDLKAKVDAQRELDEL